jgi:hypothetical protein
MHRWTRIARWRRAAEEPEPNALARSTSRSPLREGGHRRVGRVATRSISVRHVRRSSPCRASTRSGRRRPDVWLEAKGRSIRVGSMRRGSATSRLSRKGHAGFRGYSGGSGLRPLRLERDIGRKVARRLAPPPREACRQCWRSGLPGWELFSPAGSSMSGGSGNSYCAGRNSCPMGMTASPMGSIKGGRMVATRLDAVLRGWRGKSPLRRSRPADRGKSGQVIGMWHDMASRPD